MVQAIDFAVRDSAGGLVRGTVGGESGSNFIQMGSGEEISLNLSRASVVAYERTGTDLIISLSDGSQIKLAGYFAGAEPNLLYLSTNGDIALVELSGTEGPLYATYGATEGWDKYSLLDDLRFVSGDNFAEAVAYSDEPAGQGLFAPALLGGGLGAGGLAAGLLGGGVLLTGGGGGGGGGSTGGGGTGGDGGGGGGTGGGGGGGTGDRPAPTVDNPTRTDTVTTNTVDRNLVITGTGAPGDAVVVTIGTQTQTTTITPGGTWGVTFPGTSLPPDGTYDSNVVVTPPGGTPIELDGPDYIIDLTPPPVTLVSGFERNGDVENLVEHADGVTLTGTSESGASLTVTVNGHTKTVTVGATGTWSVNFTTAELPGGEYTVPAVIRATDPLGNVTIVNDRVVIDTVPNTITFNAVTADNTVNNAEATAGFSITGSGTPNTTIAITLQGLTQSVTVGADGGWTLSWAAGTLTPGEYEALISATSTDAAGNVRTATHTMRVDTATSVAFAATPVEGDNTVNGTERLDGVTLTGTTQPGATVTVEWQGTTLPATVAADGTWTVNFGVASLTTSTLPLATTATVTARDAAGNTASATKTITFDTKTNVTIDPNQLGGDNIESGSEAANGIVLTGTAEAGASVAVTFEGVTRTVTANASGVWSASWTAAEVRPGQYDSTVAVTATDLAGNTASATHAIRVDTLVSPFTANTVATGADSVINKVESASGITVTGTVEAGSSVVVRFGTGSAVNATVTGTTWSAFIPAGQIPAGENTIALQATATDAVGNTAVQTQNVQVDTLVRNFARTGGVIGGDGILNGNEIAAGLTLTGTVEPNATVVVQLANGSSQSATAGANGLWSVTFAAAQLPTGEGTSTVTMTATDRAGNTETLNASFAYDSVAPGAPNVISFDRVVDGVRGVGVVSTADDLSFFKVASSGAATAMTATESQNPAFPGETTYSFGSNRVPDGTYLVINTEDAAQNQSSTLFIVNNTGSSTVDLARTGLQDFDFSTINLHFAASASLTITDAQLRALTGADQKLTIAGGADDTVTMTGAVDTGANVTIASQVYSVYTLGSQGSTILLDDDIQKVI
ncbi:MAG: Ig-like domain-containing protein [Rhodobacteraceae bacterium]|nr:Ig-like domain-containing protein [Paracoccaceae bacterium]